MKRPHYLLLAFFVLIFFTTFSQTFNSSFNTSVTGVSPPTSSVFLDDGSYILTGYFVKVGSNQRRGFAKFNSDGSPDNAFNNGDGLPGAYDVIEVADGKLVVAGAFTTYNSEPINSSLIRINVDGTLDESFTPVEVTNGPQKLFALPDGKILLSGFFYTIDGTQKQESIIRLNSEGSWDPSFDAPYLGAISTLQTDADGKIIVGGEFSNVEGSSSANILRLNSDGSIDNSFQSGSGFDGRVNSVAVTADNKILVGGFFTTYNGEVNKYFVSLNPDGSIFHSFVGNDKPSGPVHSVAILTDNKIIIAGYILSYNSSPANHIVRLNPDGTRDNSYVAATIPNGYIEDVKINNQNEALLLGSYAFSQINGQPRKGVAILNADGSLKDFPNQLLLHSPSQARIAVKQGADKILFSHIGEYVNGVLSLEFERLTLDGQVDETFFNGHPNNAVATIATDVDNHILIGGTFTNYQSTPTNYFAKLDPHGNLDAAFMSNMGTGFDEYVSLIHPQPDNKLIVCGGFSSFNGTSRKSLLRLNADGTLDQTFNQGNGFLNTTGPILIRSMKIQPDGKILLGGTFNGFGGISRASLIRLNDDGTLDETFDIGTGLTDGEPFSTGVNAIELLSNDKILVGGSFSRYNGASSNHNLLVLNTDGSIDQALGTQGFSTVYGMAKQPDGRILITDRIKGLSRRYADGTEDPTFSEIKLEYTAESILLFGRDIILAGSLTSIDGNPTTAIGKVTLPDDPLVPSNFAANAVSTFKVSMLWTDDANNEIGYRIYRSTTTNDNFELIATLPANTTSYEDNTVGALTTYFYKINVYNASADNLYTAEQSVITPNYPPNAPSGLAITVVNSSALELSWNDNASDESGFQIERSVNNNTSYTLIETTSSNVTTYTDEDVSEQTVYFYRVRAINGIVYSSYLTEKSSHLGDPAPAAPSNLMLTVVNADLITLSWDDNSFNETAFEIYRSFDGNDFSLIETINANTESYFDTNVADGQSYYYRIRAINGIHVSESTTIVFGISQDPIPALPTDFAIQVTSLTSLTITWADNSTFETGYEIERSVGSAEAFSLHTTVGANTTQYVDLGLTPHTVHFYRVRGINVTDHGTYSSNFTTEISASPKIPIPDKPSDFIIKKVSDTSLLLEWTDNANNEEGYRVMRSDGNDENFILISTLPSNTTSFLDTDLTSTTKYYYSVVGFNVHGDSEPIAQNSIPGVHIMADESVSVCHGIFVDPGGWSNYTGESFVTTTLYPSTSGAFIQLDFESFNTQLNWDNLSIYDGESTSDPFIAMYSGEDVPAAVTATNPTGALTLQFKSNWGNKEGWTAKISCRVFPFRPTAVNVEILNEKNVEVSWVDNSDDETGFIIERSLSTEDFGFEPVGYLPANATKFTDTDVVPDVSYFYRVQSAGELDNSPYSLVTGIYFGFGGYWKKMANMDIGKNEGTAFEIDGKGYVGLGNFDAIDTQDFSKFDPANNKWELIAPFPGDTRDDASQFVIDGKAYVGTGNKVFSTKKDFWQYDPDTNTWTALADFGGASRSNAVGFSLLEKGYVGLGRSNSGHMNDFWTYDPTANSWSLVAPFPGEPRSGAVSFTIGNVAYVGSGLTDAGRVSDFYKYDPQANTWTRIADMPISGIDDAVAFSLDGMGYVGTGAIIVTTNQFWKYDPASDVWNEIVSFGGAERVSAVAFSTAEHGYVGAGWNRRDVWEFTAKIIPSAPVAPSVAKDVVTASVFALWWTYEASNASEFIIERSVGNDNSFKEIATVPGDARVFHDWNVLSETSYFYRIKVVTSDAGSSDFSNVVNGTTPPAPPVAPTLKPISDIKFNQITLNWIDNSTNETEFIIDRSVGVNNAFTTLITVSANQVDYLDETVSDLTTYFYRIRAKNLGGESEYSDTVSVTTPIAPILPPSNLVLNVKSSTIIELTWQDNASNETSILVLRGFESGPFITVATLPANANSFENSGLTEGVTYYYKVRAVNDVSLSDFSETVSVTTPLSVPVAPSQLTAVLVGEASKITLNWTDNSFNEDEFVVQRSEDGSTFTEYATTQASNFDDMYFNTIPKVFYRVSARNSQHTSPSSNIASIIITAIETPAVLAGVSVYPNPALESINVTMNGNQSGEIRTTITDVTGKTLFIDSSRKESAEFNKLIQVSEWKGKLLFLTVTFGGQSKTFKVMVK